MNKIFLCFREFPVGGVIVHDRNHIEGIKINVNKLRRYKSRYKFTFGPRDVVLTERTIKKMLEDKKTGKLDLKMPFYKCAILKICRKRKNRQLTTNTTTKSPALERIEKKIPKIRERLEKKIPQIRERLQSIFGERLGRLFN